MEGAAGLLRFQRCFLVLGSKLSMAVQRTYLKLLRELQPLFPQAQKGARVYSGLSVRLAGELEKVAEASRTRLSPPIAPPPILDLKAEREDPFKALTSILGLFEGMPNWACGTTQMNLMPSPTGVSALAMHLAGIFYADICSPKLSGGKITELERNIGKVFAHLAGYNPKNAAGFFTYAGTLSIEYAIKAALSNRFPDRRRLGNQGIEDALRIICSERAHCASSRVADALGLGEERVIKVEEDSSGAMDINQYEATLKRLYREGKEILCVIATLGTTDAFAIDDLKAINAINRKLAGEKGIWLHADAAVGWAWTVFCDYDFESNPLQFPPETLLALNEITQKLDGIRYGNSVNFNLHKYGYTPLPDSYVLFRNKKQMHVLQDEVGQRCVEGGYLGAHLMETTRSAGGLFAITANLMVLRQTGYQAILGRLVGMGLLLRQKLRAIPDVEVSSEGGLGPATIFRVVPARKTLSREKINHLNLELLERIRNSFDPPILLSSARVRDSVFLRSVIISPFTDEKAVGMVASTMAKLAKTT